MKTNQDPNRQRPGITVFWGIGGYMADSLTINFNVVLKWFDFLKSRYIKYTE